MDSRATVRFAVKDLMRKLNGNAGRIAHNFGRNALGMKIKHQIYFTFYLLDGNRLAAVKL